MSVERGFLCFLHLKSSTIKKVTKITTKYMKKHITLALLLLLSASPAAANGIPSIRAGVQGEVKVDAQVRDRMSDRAADHLVDFSTRLERLEVRVSTLIKRLKAKNIDMAASEKAFADFSAKLDIAQKNIADLSLFLSGNVNAQNNEELKTKRKATRESLKDAHAALKVTIKEIASAIRSAKKVDVKADVRVDASVRSN